MQTKKFNSRKHVGPGLAQLVERLTHRYSESMSSNSGNLTSATVCGDRTGYAPAAKRSASVAPEVDLRECTLHSPLQKVNKAEPTLALNPRGNVTRNPKQGYKWPQKRTCLSAKKSRKHTSRNFPCKTLMLSTLRREVFKAACFTCCHQVEVPCSRGQE